MVAVLELNEAIQTVIATLANIEELKPEQECVIFSLKAKIVLPYCHQSLGEA